MASQITVTSTGRFPAPVEYAPRAFTVAQMHLDVPRGDLPLPVLHDGNSVTAASYRVLAHRLRREGDPRVIAVTSARPREGATTCAVNLALALAERGRPDVLLVEANRIRPALAESFDCSVPACFEKQLASSCSTPDPEWWVTAVAYENLHMLAVDRVGASGRAVSPRAYRVLLERARRAYGYVIVDCPSVAAGGDLGVVEDLADGVLFAGRKGVSTRRQLRAAVDQLAPASFLGVVLLEAEV